MNKIAFIDVGELGWSLYLSAHIRMLKSKSDLRVAVITLPDRKCLYANLADDILEAPKAFYEKYDLSKQDSFKIRKVGWDELESFFSPSLPDGYHFAEHTEYPNIITSDKRIFAPYKYSKLPEGVKGGYLRTEIMVFPRYRPGLWILRNLPEVFYVDLIKQLCDEFPKLTVRTIGTKNGAYDMKIDKPNYINWIGKASDLQDMIDRCQVTVAAVGSQSAPPKISLIQGIPTFIIGHQRERHIQGDNWMNTKVDFYQIDKRAYRTFNDPACIEAIIRFVRGCK